MLLLTKARLLTTFPTWPDAEIAFRLTVLWHQRQQQQQGLWLQDGFACQRQHFSRKRVEYYANKVVKPSFSFLPLQSTLPWNHVSAPDGIIDTDPDADGDDGEQKANRNANWVTRRHWRRANMQPGPRKGSSFVGKSTPSRGRAIRLEFSRPRIEMEEGRSVELLAENGPTFSRKQIKLCYGWTTGINKRAEWDFHDNKSLVEGSSDSRSGGFWLDGMEFFFILSVKKRCEEVQ